LTYRRQTGSNRKSLLGARLHLETERDTLNMLCKPSVPRAPSQMAGGYAGNLAPYFIEINTIGGRGGTRTRGPLLAKRVVKNTKVLRWCRLLGKPSNFPLFKCPKLYRVLVLATPLKMDHSRMSQLTNARSDRLITI
jgi:hypothetical protein